MIPPLKGGVVGKQTVAVSFMECSQCPRLLCPVLAQGRQRFAVLPSGQSAQHFPQVLILYCIQNIFRGQVGNGLQLGKVAFYAIQNRRAQTVCRVAGGGFAEYIVVGEDQLGNIPAQRVSRCQCAEKGTLRFQHSLAGFYAAQQVQ